MPGLLVFRSAIFSSLLFCFVASSSADTLKSASSPPGATVELAGPGIQVAGKFHGNSPAARKLPAGSHTSLLESPGRSGFTRTPGLPKSGKLNLKAISDASAHR